MSSDELQSIQRKPPVSLCEIGGVEEAKEDEPFSPLSFPHRNTSLVQHTAQERQPSNDEDEDRGSKTLPQQIQQLANQVMVSCGAALSVVSDGCAKWPPNPPEGPVAESQHGKVPLSIADELRKLAVKEGRVFGGGMRHKDIPRFLAEDAVYLFEDDDVSAISQNTLEEMMRHGIKYPIRRKASSHSSDGAQPPEPTRTFSASTGSNEPKTASR